ncbi:hypothetical protein ACLOJK_034552, partial [Asimina triloba]
NSKQINGLDQNSGSMCTDLHAPPEHRTRTLSSPNRTHLRSRRCPATFCRKNRAVHRLSLTVSMPEKPLQIINFGKPMLLLMVSGSTHLLR